MNLQEAQKQFVEGLLESAVRLRTLREEGLIKATLKGAGKGALKGAGIGSGIGAGVEGGQQAYGINRYNKAAKTMNTVLGDSEEMKQHHLGSHPWHKNLGKAAAIGGAKGGVLGGAIGGVVGGVKAFRKHRRENNASSS